MQVASRASPAAAAATSCSCLLYAGKFSGCFGVLLFLGVFLLAALVVLRQALSPGLVRAASIMLIFVAGLAGALLPWCLRSAESAPVLLGRGNALSAGVMLAAGFIHLLGDSAQELQPPPPPCAPDRAGGHRLEMSAEGYPVAMLLCTVGFMLTLILEELGHFLTRDQRVIVANASADSEMTAFDVPIEAGRRSRKGPVDRATEPVHHSSFSTKVVLAAALSFHSVMEGMALGAVPVDGVLQILLTILAHKSLAAFALGSTLLRGDADPSFGRFVAIGTAFASASPLGSLLAIWAEEVLTPTFAPVILALSAGTFICEYTVYAPPC